MKRMGSADLFSGQDSGVLASHTGLLFHIAAAGLALGPAFSLPIWVAFLPLLSPLNGSILEAP